MSSSNASIDDHLTITAKTNAVFSNYLFFDNLTGKW
jgi:hypothetical protein